VSRLSELADRLRSAEGDARDRAVERIEEAAGKIAGRFGADALAALRRDEAFAELLGVADETLDELAADLAENAEADEAFATIGDRFGWGR
jgi:hypothetical protein